jgi:hypothetical protein
MNTDLSLHSLLHKRFQDVFGPAHHNMYDTDQWSLVPSTGLGTINVLLNGTRQGPLVWVFDSQDVQHCARHFAVTQEQHIDELIDQLRVKLVRERESPEDGRRGDSPRQFRDDVLTIEELTDRPSRTPEYLAENHALLALAEGMGRDPQSILQLTVDTALHLCRGQSSGISILEPEGDTEVFRWHATAGAFASKAGVTVPRESLDGIVLERNALLLFEGRWASRSIPRMRRASTVAPTRLERPTRRTTAISTSTSSTGRRPPPRTSAWTTHCCGRGSRRPLVPRRC